ncbi:MAG TPA: MFS transporter [Solirubrobacteraceae bacterium]|nr:MFS transporter [Solirubrobacteraceae bacterium]
MRSLPQSPRVRRILLAYTLNEVGTWLGYVALSVAVYDATGSGAAVAGLLVASRLVPALIVPALVARVEASRRSGELSVLYLVQAACTAALAATIGDMWLPAVLLLVMIDGAAALTASALLRAEATRAQGSARSATAALNFAYTAALIVGPALAGVLVGAWGAEVALLIDAASFVVAAALLRTLHPHIEEAGRESVRARLAVAWSHLRGTPALWRLLVVEAVAIVFFAAAEPVEVIYAKSTLAAGDWGFGLLLATWGVGMALGGVLFGAARTLSLRSMLISGTLAIGFGYLGFAAAPNLALACVAAVIGGIGTGMQWGAWLAAAQILTPSALHGRLMGAMQSINSLCPALGFALGGAVATLSSARVAFVVAGGASVMLAGVFVRGTTRLPAPTDAPAGEALAPQTPAAEEASVAL